MNIGTTTFGLRYPLMDPGNSPKLSQIIRHAREAGVERLQVCENARPLEISKADSAKAERCAADLGVELLLGGKTLQEQVVADYLVLAQELSCDHLRIVFNAKINRNFEVFTPTDFLAAITQHIPDKGLIKGVR